MPRYARPIAVSLAAFGIIAATGLAYFGLTSPSLPYTISALSIVDRPTDSALAGELQAGDRILTFNGEPLYRCMYLVGSPVYRAPRGVPIPIEYGRLHNGVLERGLTNIVLRNPSFHLIFNRSLTYLVASTFVLTGVVIFVGARANSRNLLLGAAGVASGLVIAAALESGSLNAPLSFLYWLGLPVWAVLLVASHAFWPVDQLQRKGVRLVLAAMGVVAVSHFALVLMGSVSLGCYTNDQLPRLASWAYLSNVLLPFPIVLGLLLSAYRSTGNPFSRLQIRAISWAVLLGFGIPLILSVLPEYAELRWVAPIEVTILVSGIIPLTYLFVLYRGDLLRIDRHFHRLIFTLLFIVVWGAFALVVVNAVTYWIPEPDPLLVAALASLPALLTATWLRSRLGLLADLALYGEHYDFESVVSHLGRSLAGASREESLGGILTEELTQALSIREGSLWLAADEENMRLVSHSNSIEGATVDDLMPIDQLPAGEATVEILSEPVLLGSDPTPWRAIMRLKKNGELLGLLLLGEKQQEHAYSEKDARVLRTLAGWISATAANIRFLSEQQAMSKRERELMLSLVENEEQIRGEVAGDLHDQGITALGTVRLMVEQERGKPIVMAGLERVIEDLRRLSNSRLSPAGLDQGLPQALEAMVATQRELGLPVSLEVGEAVAGQPSIPSTVARELYYTAQEAVINAGKHAVANKIEVRLSRSTAGILLEIRDDGKGLDPTVQLADKEMHGLRIMHARANRVGGKLNVESSPGGGTHVRVEVFLPVSM